MTIAAVSLASSLDAQERLLAISADVEFPEYSTRIGGQGSTAIYTMNPEKAWVVQEAEYQLALGSDTFKFMLRPYRNKYSGTDIFTEEGPPYSKPINTLVDRAKNVDAFRTILDMPFRYTMIWAFPIAGINNDQTGIYAGETAGINLGNGYSKAEAAAEYKELYDLTRYLIEKYEGTGRSFFIGNWEGDWVLLAGQGRLQHNNGKANKRLYEPSKKKLQTMRKWFANRQKAVEDARNSLRDAKGVQVYHYVEVNHFENAMDNIEGNGDMRLVNEVLPHIKVDAISYSAWNGTNQTKELPERLHEHLQYIEDHAQFTGHWPFKKSVFVGEYGREKGAETTKCINAAASWGCPFTLYWCIIPNYPANNHYMVERDGSFTESYKVHRDALSNVICQRDIWRLFLCRNPTEDELNGLLANFQTLKPTDLLSVALNSQEFATRISDTDYVAALMDQMLIEQQGYSRLYNRLLEGLRSGAVNRMQALVRVLDSNEFKDAVSDTLFNKWIRKSVLALKGPTKSGETPSMQSKLSRSQAWELAINSPQLSDSVLKLRFANTVAPYSQWQYRHNVCDEVYQHFSVDLRSFVGAAVK